MLSLRHAPPLLLLLAFACRTEVKSEVVVVDAQASPQAKAEPAPLTSVVAAASATSVADAGPAPSILRADRAIEADSLPSGLTSFALVASLRPLEPPAAVHGPEINGPAVDAQRKKEDLALAIEIAASRMRIVFGPGFIVPAGIELRARRDFYGFLLLDRTGDAYRVLAPGTLRALVGERRVDVSPLSTSEQTQGGEGAKRLGLRTRKVEIVTRAARATVELAKVPELGEGGVLLARVILDLISAPPQTSLASLDEVPLHAELHWTTRGGIAFDVTSLAKRPDASTTTLLAPPPEAGFRLAPLTSVSGELVLTPTELGTLHNGPVDIGIASAPLQGTLNVFNGTDAPRAVWLDGVRVGWLAPETRLSIPSLQRGHYQIETRSYLDDAADAPRTVTAPGDMVIGAADAGAGTK